MARKNNQQLRQQESQQAQSTFEDGNAQPTWSDIELEDHICSASFSSVDKVTNDKKSFPIVFHSSFL